MVAAMSSASQFRADSLGIPVAARQLAVSGTSASVTLSKGVSRASIVARGGPVRFVVGMGAQTANATTSHYLGAEERIDIKFQSGSTIAAIRANGDTTAQALEITELGY